MKAYLIHYIGELPVMFADGVEAVDIVYAETRGKARGVFCKSWGIPFISQLFIRKIYSGPKGTPNTAALAGDSIWALVDPAYAAYKKAEGEWR